MPKHFKFFIQSESNVVPHFQCQLASLVCDAVTKRGERCKRKVIIGLPFCWSHLLSNKHLRIKDSLIPNAGKGLFVEDKSKPEDAIIFKKGDKILDYVGEVVTMEELDNRYGEENTAPYGVAINKKANRYEDAACRRGAGSLINQGTPTGLTKYNCDLKVGGQKKDKIIIKATANIKNGRELYTNYGEEYVFEENTRYSTK